MTTQFHYSKYLKGFGVWFTQNLQALTELFTPEVQAEFDCIEDFGTEVYLEILAPQIDKTSEDGNKPVILSPSFCLLNYDY